MQICHFLLIPQIKRIEVTTFADEDGENTNACSLREAIKVAETRKSAYGCTVFSLDTDQVIQLKAGTYTLNKELVPNANISIYGYGEREEDKIWSEKNVLTNDYPALPELKTRINAAGKSRIFNTAENQKALFLQNIIIENGIASNQGGAIYAGGNVTLLNSQILNSQAPKGGAVFLGGSGVNLSITHSLLQGNQASTGSVLAMSCKNGTEYAKREVTLTSSSIIKNGSSNSASTFEFCGEPKATFTINTIAQNIASTLNGVILKFTGDAIPGNTTNPSTILSGGSSLKLQNNTIVENNAHTTFLYDSLGGKELNFNIIGYNPVGYACRYLAGSAADLKNSGLRLSFNALNLSNNTDKCDLPTEVLSSANKTIDISGVPFNSLLERHEKAEAVTGFLPLYFPLVAAGKEDLIDVDPEGKAICADIDQRGLARLPTNKLYYQPDNIARNSCDIGSVELMKLTAGDLRGLGNSSLTTLLEGYQTQYDTAEKNLTNPLYSYLWNVLKIDLANYKNLLDQTKANAKYRAIYIDLKANGLPLPNEDSSHLLKVF